jgi:hypothetical protein
MNMQRVSRFWLIFLAAAVGAAVWCERSQAVTTLFADSFDRPDHRDIDNEMTGITNNTGTTFSASAVYSQPWLDPNNGPPTFGVQDGVATNGGGAQVLSNQLQLAVGQGTSNAFVNHNFTNSVITTDGGFKVSLAVGTYNQATAGQGGGFGVGMSLAEANSAHDAQDAAGNSLTHAFGTVSNAISDFWVGLRGNNTLAWGSGNGTVNTATVGAKTGTISANFNFSNFSAGSPVSYEVFYDGASQGIGTFNWSGTNENYIGLDARDNTAVNLDNFLIETILPSPKPTLVINRDTGNITIQNLTNSPLSISGYSLTTAQGGFDQANWSKIQTQGIDTNDTWITFTDPASTTDLAEGTLGEYTIAASNPGTTDQIDLGNAWRRSPFEDVTFRLLDAANNEVPVLVSYILNGGNPFQLGDFNLSGGLDAPDWVTLRNHLTSNVSAMSQIDRYFAGDVNGDSFVNQADFRQFKTLYTAAHGAGSFEAMLASVPEPASAMLCLGAAMALLGRQLRRRALARTCLFVAMAICGLMANNRARAVDLFIDSFDRPDNRDIDAETTGITNNTGTVFGASAVYSQPWLDPNNAAPTFGVEDADATNGGGAQILSNQLQLAIGQGTSNAYVNHNFTNSAITTAKGFRVTLDVGTYVQTTNGQGGAFAVGMSQAEANSAHDAQDAAGNSLTHAFGNASTAISDFWLGLRGNNTLGWGAGNVAPTTATVAAKTGTISAEFLVNDFNAGSSVAYQVFYNGVSQGFGAFAWSAANANYIGLDARDNTSVALDNFKVETVTGLAPQALRLQVNTSSGVVSILGGGSNNLLDFYEITSAGGGVVAGNFNGIGGDSGLPVGNGTGNGWELGGANSSTSLTEAYLLSESTIAANASAIPLGSIYNTVANTHDLQFSYTATSGLQRLGFIEYITSSLPDFNGNGTVDAADYVIWRGNNGLMGGATLSQGDANGDGNVTSADYTLWKANFGVNAGSSAVVFGQSAVPEPSGTVLLLIVGAAMGATRIRRRAIA